MKKRGRVLALALSMLMLCSCSDNSRRSEDKSTWNDKISSLSSAKMSELYKKVCNYQIYSYWCREENEFGYYDVVNNKYYPICSYPCEVEDISYNGFISFCKGQDGDSYKGYMNSDGEIVIEAQYNVVRPFTESGLAAVSKGICIDTTDDVYDVYDVYGYINTDGEYVIEPKYKAVTNFSKDGIAFVILTDSKKGNYIDTEGNIISKLEKFDYKESQTFSEYGVAFTGITDENTYGLIDTKGNWIYKFETNYSVDCNYLGNNYYTVSVPYDDKDFLVCGDGTTINLQDKGWEIHGRSKDDRLVAYDEYTREYGELNLKTQKFEPISQELKEALSWYDEVYEDYVFYVSNYQATYLNGHTYENPEDLDGHGQIVDINNNVVSEKDAEYRLQYPYSLECW